MVFRRESGTRTALAQPRSHRTTYKYNFSETPKHRKLLHATDCTETIAKEETKKKKAGNYVCSKIVQETEFEEEGRLTTCGQLTVSNPTAPQGSTKKSRVRDRQTKHCQRTSRRAKDSNKGPGATRNESVSRRMAKCGANAGSGFSVPRPKSDYVSSYSARPDRVAHREGTADGIPAPGIGNLYFGSIVASRISAVDQSSNDLAVVHVLYIQSTPGIWPAGGPAQRTEAKKIDLQGDPSFLRVPRNYASSARCAGKTPRHRRYTDCMTSSRRILILRARTVSRAVELWRVNGLFCRTGVTKDGRAESRTTTATRCELNELQ